MNDLINALQEFCSGTKNVEKVQYIASLLISNPFPPQGNEFWNDEGYDLIPLWYKFKRSIFQDGSFVQALDVNTLITLEHNDFEKDPKSTFLVEMALRTDKVIPVWHNAIEEGRFHFEDTHILDLSKRSTQILKYIVERGDCVEIATTLDMLQSTHSEDSFYGITCRALFFAISDARIDAIEAIRPYCENVDKKPLINTFSIVEYDTLEFLNKFNIGDLDVALYNEFLPRDEAQDFDARAWQLTDAVSKKINNNNASDVAMGVVYLAQKYLTEHGLEKWKDMDHSSHPVFGEWWTHPELKDKRADAMGWLLQQAPNCDGELWECEIAMVLIETMSEEERTHILDQQMQVLQHYPPYSARVLQKFAGEERKPQVKRKM